MHNIYVHFNILFEKLLSITQLKFQVKFLNEVNKVRNVMTLSRTLNLWNLNEEVLLLKDLQETTGVAACNYNMYFFLRFFCVMW